MTICAPTSAQGSLAGSRSAQTLIFFPSTEMKSSPASILLGRLPRIESYLSRCASVAGLVKSFTATKSISVFPRVARKTLRPMRPKPLMPTLTAICLLLGLYEAKVQIESRSEAEICSSGRFHQTLDRTILDCAAEMKTRVSHFGTRPVLHSVETA